MEKRNYVRKLMDAANLRAEPQPGLPIIEMVGDRRVLIEKHCGVLEYEQNMVCVKIKQGCICVKGCNLEIMQMTKNQLIISGEIFAVELSKEKGRELV